MKLIMGLGNPGEQFVGTRHNTGFWVCDELATRQGISFSHKTKFQAEVAECTIGDTKIILAKPQTFYNDAGMSYLALTQFYHIPPEDTLIIHDELALPFGTIRIRQGSSDAGNNGIKSINAHGGESSWRLRFGIANSQHRSGEDVGFVLGHFNAEERVLKQKYVAPILGYCDDFIRGELQPHSEVLLTPEE